MAIVLGMIAPHRFLSASDLALVGTLFGNTARWDAPALVTANLTLAFDHERDVVGDRGIEQPGILGHEGHLHLQLLRQMLGVLDAAEHRLEERIVIALPWLDVVDPQGLAFRLRVTAFVPLAITSALVATTAMGAHNDLLMLVAILAALLLFQRQHWMWGLLALALAAHVKLTALLVRR